MRTFLLSALLLTANLSAPCAESPGFVDFSKIAELAGGSTVDVHLKGPLLSMAARIVDKGEAEVAELLRSLKLVRVNVFKVDEANRAEIQKRILALRAELIAQKWEQLVSVRDKKDDVGVYIKTRGEEAIEGVVVSVMDGKGEAVLVNIVGDLKPDQIGMLADKFNIDPLKKVQKHSKKN